MKKLLLLVTLVVFLIVPSFVLAETDTSTTSANPASTYNLLSVNNISNLRDRIFERITLFFKFSNQDSYNYQKYLADKRLAELKYAVENDQGNMIEETSSRYASYLGRLNSFVIDKKMTGKKSELLTMYSLHSQVLQTLSNKFEADSGFWLLIQHDINTTKILSDQLKNLQ